MVVIGTGNGNETLHLAVRDDNLLTATGISDILQISYLRFYTLHIRRAGMNKKQVMDHRNQGTNLLPFLYADLVLHGNKTAHPLFFK